MTPEAVVEIGQMALRTTLLVAGPMPKIDSPDPGPVGSSGSTVIAEFDSLDDAREWADTDPYVEAGVYENVDVRPFIKALP